MNPTQGEVKEHLDYNSETGELRWRVRKKGRSTEGPVGSLCFDGYLRLKLNRREFKSHRVIWLWWYGYWPEHDIDHIDRDRANNRITNLREVSRVCNLRNTGLLLRNRSGVKGVCLEKCSGRWEVRIRVNGKGKYLGTHSDFTEAVAHRLAAEQCLDWAGCNSNSSAFQYMKKETDK